MASDGKFYGVTYYGGSTEDTNSNNYGNGTIYRYDPATKQETVLHSFGDGTIANDGSIPVGGFIQASDGNLYGVTSKGGAANGGTIIELSLNLGASGSAPSGLTALAGNDRAILTWKPSAGAASYNIYEGTTPGGEGSTPIVVGVTQPSYTVNKLTNGRTYYFRVTAENTAGESEVSNEANATPSTGVSITFPAGLQMFSLPFAYSDTSLDTLFGYSGTRLAAWLPYDRMYALTPAAPSDQIALGQGYWVRFPQSVTVTALGRSADTNHNFDIPLVQGWNMIGDPFFISVSIADLTFNGGTKTFAQATSGNSPLVGSALWGYSPSQRQYYMTTLLSPDQGYWIYVSDNTDVQVPHP